MKTLRLLLLSTASWAALSAQTETGTHVLLAIQPNAPVRLGLLNPTDLDFSITSRASGVAAPIEGALFNQHVEVRNLGPVGVLGIQVRWSHVGAATGGGCSGVYTPERSKPWLEPGESAAIRRTLKRNHQDIEATIDLVLLNDGTFWGPNVCGFLEKVQYTMRNDQALYSLLLGILEREGIEAVEARIRKGEALSHERVRYFDNLRRAQP